MFVEAERPTSYFYMVPFWDMFSLAKSIFIRDIVILEDMSVKNDIRLNGFGTLR